MTASITQTTSCDDVVVRVDYTASGGYVTIDGNAAPANGQLVVAKSDHVAHVIAVDSAPLGERLTYAIVSGHTGCPTTVQGASQLAFTGSHTDVVASLGLAFILCGVALRRLMRYVVKGATPSFTK